MTPFKLLKPLFRIWFTVDFWLSKVPNHLASKLSTLLVVACGALFIAFLQLSTDLSINVNQASGMIVLIVIITLIKQALFNKKEPQRDERYITIVPDDFLAISLFAYTLSVLVTLILCLIITGDIWVAITAALFVLLLFLRSDSFIGPSSDDQAWKLSLEDKEILFHNKVRTAHLKLNNVALMKVFTAFGYPKKICFKMNDGQSHQIKYYRKQDEILKHAINTVPASKVEWVSYT